MPDVPSNPTDGGARPGYFLTVHSRLSDPIRRDAYAARRFFRKASRRG